MVDPCSVIGLTLTFGFIFSSTIAFDTDSGSRSRRGEQFGANYLVAPVKKMCQRLTELIFMQTIGHTTVETDMDDSDDDIDDKITVRFVV